MQLRYNNYVRNNVVYMELETANFTHEENAALEKFGEPVIKIDKVYSGHPVSIERKIKTGFKVRVKFDGSDNVQNAIEAANEFYDDLVDTMRDEMSTLMCNYRDPEFELKAKSGSTNIDYM